MSEETREPDSGEVWENVRTGRRAIVDSAKDSPFRNASLWYRYVGPGRRRFARMPRERFKTLFRFVSAEDRK